MKNSDKNTRKQYLLEMVEYSSDPILISKDLIIKIFEPIPKPDKEEMEARLVLAIRNVYVESLHPDIGKPSIQQFEDWCKRNDIEQTYDIEKSMYEMKKGR